MEKIVKLQTPKGWTPFICVEGSSGMGKTQLAFALGGRLPYFYWPTTRCGEAEQVLYANFNMISDAFVEVNRRDRSDGADTDEALNSKSPLYGGELWTYGFIFALLNHCRLRRNQEDRMVHFAEPKTLVVNKCYQRAVTELCSKIVDEGKKVPFFVLDELTPGSSESSKRLAALQRNVFRACDLVVVVMGTDSRAMSLMTQGQRSSQQAHYWMCVIPRFPPYQSLPYGDETTQAIWEQLKHMHPVLSKIVESSRGRFARHFVEGVMKYAMSKPSINEIALPDLLDTAFLRVSQAAQENKLFMKRTEGRDAQLKAISYNLLETCKGDEPVPKKPKRDVGVESMNLHFANLKDKEMIDLKMVNEAFYMLEGPPTAISTVWSPLCRFPSLNKDVLLYLAVLGGKDHSAYYEITTSKAYSTQRIMKEFKQSGGFDAGENTNTVSKDEMFYENFVAHMFFVASRRNGVRGVSFNDFLTGLLDECKVEFVPKTPTKLTMSGSEERVTGCDLLEGYAALTELCETPIPFFGAAKCRVAAVHIGHQS